MPNTVVVQELEIKMLERVMPWNGGMYRKVKYAPPKIGIIAEGATITPEAIGVEVANYRIVEVRDPAHRKEPIYYGVEVNQDNLFKELVSVHDHLYRAAVSEKAEEIWWERKWKERRIGAEFESDRIKKLPWWRRLFNRF